MIKFLQTTKKSERPLVFLKSLPTKWRDLYDVSIKHKDQAPETMSVETRNGDCDIKEWGWWWQRWIIRSPHLKSTKDPFCLRPLLILQNDQLFRFWSRMYWHFLPTNLLEFLLQCKLVFWKTRGPKLVSTTEIVYRNLFSITQKLLYLIWYLNSNLPDQIEKGQYFRFKGKELISPFPIAFPTNLKYHPTLETSNLLQDLIDFFIFNVYPAGRKWR